MADPVDEDLHALGVTDVDEDEDLKALGVADASPAPPPTMVAPNGPVLRAPERTAWNTLRDVAEATGVVPSGIIPDEGTARGAVASALQGPTLNWADEAAGLLAKRDAALKYMVEGGQKPNMPQTYVEGRDAFRNVEGALRKENPAAAFALTVGSGAALGNPVSVEGGLARYLPALVEGGIAGAGAAAESGDIPEAAAVGAPLGVAGQAFGEAVGDVVGMGVRAGLRGAQRLTQGVVTPSPAAKYLQSKGVNDLTIGQMAPNSALAQLEEASTSVSGVGPSITAQREAGRRAWQKAAMETIAPPGGPPVPSNATPATMLDDAYKAFENAYAPAKGHQLDPQPIQDILWEIDNPGLRATDKARQSLRKWMEDQLTALRLDRDGMVSSDSALALRTTIREEARAENDRATRLMLEHLDDALTGAIVKQLPEGAETALASADAAYARYKVLENAVRMSGDQPSGFSPGQMSEAVKQATDNAAYARGAGGVQRKMAQAGRETLDARIPLTGARLLSAGPAKWLTAPAAYLANLPKPKQFLLGDLPWQRSASEALGEMAENVTPAVREPLGRYASAAAYAHRNAAEAPERGDTTTSNVVSGLVTSNPEALGPYAAQLEQAQASGNLPIVHYALQQKDPEYRRMLDTIRSGGTQ